MKKILAFALLLAACSEDNEPVFKIQDTFFTSRFEKFVEVASYHDVIVPKNNMILRYASDENPEVNDSRAYKDGDQLYIDIDEQFIDIHAREEDHLEIILFQQLANGLVGTPFRDCGMMKKVVTPNDIPDATIDYAWYANLFDSSSACL